MTQEEVAQTAQFKESVLKEMIQLRGSNILKYLYSKLDKRRRDLALAESDVATRWLQGKVQELEELIFEIEGARGKLDRPVRPYIANKDRF